MSVLSRFWRWLRKKFRRKPEADWMANFGGATHLRHIGIGTSEERWQRSYDGRRWEDIDTSEW